MTPIEKIVVCLYFFAIICWQAFHQAQLFKEQKTISHFWKGVWYGCAIAIATIPAIIVCGWWRLLEIPAIALVERMALFDFILNKAHNEPFFYNGPKVQDAKAKGSWIDRLENKLTDGELKALKIGYIVLFIVVIIFIK